MNLRDLFNENDASSKAQSAVKNNSEAIGTADKNVGSDGNEISSQNKSAKSGEKSNAETLTGNVSSSLEGNNNQKANTTTASKNFSPFISETFPQFFHKRDFLSTSFSMASTACSTKAAADA